MVTGSANVRRTLVAGTTMTNRAALMLLCAATMGSVGCGYSFFPSNSLDRLDYVNDVLLSSDGGRVQCSVPAPPMDVQEDIVDAAMDVQPDIQPDVQPDIVEAGMEAGPMGACSANGPERMASCPRTPFQTAVRFAHFVNDLSVQRVDVCLQRVGDTTNTWIGPMLKVDNNRDSGGMLQGMSIGQVTRYFPLSPGNYRVRMVNGQGSDGSISCDAPLSNTEMGSPMEISLPAEMLGPMAMRRTGVRESVEEHRFHTLVLTGRATGASTTPPTATLLSDRHEGCNTSLSPSCTMMIRAFHAAPGAGAATVSTGAGLPLTRETLYRFTGVGPLNLDCNEFSELAVYRPGESVELTISAGTVAVQTDVRLTSGVMSVFLVGLPSEPRGSANGLRGIACDDLALTATSFSRCRAISMNDPCAANPIPASCR